MTIKKATALLILLACAIVMTYHLVDVTPDRSLQPIHKAYKILNYGHCAACHVHSPELPFYANFPIIGKTVKKDVEMAIREFNVDDVLNGIKLSQPIDEIALNKLEYAFYYETMPPLKYHAVHWGSIVNSNEKEMMLEWIKLYRRENHYNGIGDTILFGNEPVQPIPDSIPVNNSKVELGRQLFNDVRLSVDNTLSCASCHDLKLGGTDNKSFSDGVNGQIGGINAPTNFNAVFNFVQFWDGRAATLAEQAAAPPTNPIEMAHKSWRDIENVLLKDRKFVKRFTKVYHSGVTEANICDAIAEYEKTLITPNAPFDQYLKGDTNAITEQQKTGYQLFKDNSCAICHGGQNLGGLSYDFMGNRKDYFLARGTALTEEDYGRGKQEEDPFFDHRFKTPTLRNVALTHPYFHDSTQPTLTDAVNAMMEFQLNKKLKPEETAAIVSFLESLTGEIPEK